MDEFARYFAGRLKFRAAFGFLGELCVSLSPLRLIICTVTLTQSTQRDAEFAETAEIGSEQTSCKAGQRSYFCNTAASVFNNFSAV
jgi:hypothetical protein